MRGVVLIVVLLVGLAWWLAWTPEPRPEGSGSPVGEAAMPAMEEGTGLAGRPAHAPTDLAAAAAAADALLSDAERAHLDWHLLGGTARLVTTDGIRLWGGEVDPDPRLKTYYGLDALGPDAEMHITLPAWTGTVPVRMRGAFHLDVSRTGVPQEALADVIEVIAPDPDVIRGVVVDADGEPLADLHLILTATPDKPLVQSYTLRNPWLESITDARGRFAFAGLREGMAYGLRWAGGAGSWEQHPEPLRRGDGPLRIQVFQRGVRIRVIDARRKTVLPDARVMTMAPEAPAGDHGPSCGACGACGEAPEGGEEEPAPTPPAPPSGEETPGPPSPDDEGPSEDPVGEPQDIFLPGPPVPEPGLLYPNRTPGVFLGKAGEVLSLWVEHPGHRTSEVEVPILDDWGIRTVTVALDPDPEARRVTVRVTDEAGRPLRGIRVRHGAMSDPFAVTQDDDQATRRTDAEGRVEIGPIHDDGQTILLDPPTPEQVGVTPSCFLEVWADREIPPGPRPSVDVILDRGGRLQVELSWGSRERAPHFVDAHLRVCAVEGGDPIPPQHPWLQAHGGRWEEVHTDAHLPAGVPRQLLSAPLAPGTYWLRVDVPSEDGSSTWSHAEKVEVKPGVILPLRIHLSPETIQPPAKDLCMASCGAACG